MMRVLLITEVKKTHTAPSNENQTFRTQINMLPLHIGILIKTEVSLFSYYSFEFLPINPLAFVSVHLWKQSNFPLEVGIGRGIVSAVC